MKSTDPLSKVRIAWMQSALKNSARGPARLRLSGLEELATPYFTFIDAGASVTLASMKGGPAPIDPRSVKAKGENEASVDRFLDDEAAYRALNDTIPISTIDAKPYDAVFLPGDHGTMWDLPESAELAALLGKAWGNGKVVAAVCHGPAGLVNAKDEAGSPLVRGRRVTAFSDSEEHAVGLDTAVPFLLESRLRERGGRYESAADFQPFAIADGLLVTGQNPTSSVLTAKLTLGALAIVERR